MDNLNMRLGQKKDIPFVISQVKEGLHAGNFFFEKENELLQFEDELIQVTEAHERNIMKADFLFIFDDMKKNKTVGFALLTGRNGPNGLASHIEIRMFGVESSERKQGIGTLMLENLKRATPGHKIEASCLPGSDVMARLLTHGGFQQISISQWGKRTFRL